ncbi:MAG: aspartate kinase [Pirellulales bacterium]
MALIVQKFGGTSVADSTKILAAARKAIQAKQNGNQVVMVVSAMGKNTDVLVDLAHEIMPNPPAREMDMLLSTGEQVSVALVAMAIHSLGHKGVSLTGGQIGIRTDSTHTKARIRSISTERMQRLLNDDCIVIAAGFQGIDEDFNITTLGRGGSDTTAVALAAVLGADSCEIYTDVEGVYTTDPRIVPEARKIAEISYDEMLELASLGAGVMHSRSIEFAKKYDVPVHVRSSFAESPGTMIRGAVSGELRPVIGAALNRGEARVTITNVPDVPGTSHEIFSRIAARNISVDMIVQNIGSGGKADISFTVPRSELAATLDALKLTTFGWENCTVTHDDQVAKISAVGTGMAHQPGVAQSMFGALAAENINIQMITTSEIKISALVQSEDAVPGLRTIHRIFQLDAPSTNLPSSGGPAAAMQPTRTAAAQADIVASLQHVDMEELAITGIGLDDTQGRITIRGIPDRPGVAHHVFSDIAAAGISVDMIIQSYRADSLASLSFTVPRADVTRSEQIARKIAAELGCQEVSSSPQVAKLSVSGIGLRTHTGVAIRMFRALANAKINVLLISTSEVRVNVVVDGSVGAQALQCLEAAFADVLRT